MKPSVRYGLLLAGIGILLSLITFITGLDKSDAGKYINWLNIPIMIALMVTAIKESRVRIHHGFITFGEAFKVTAVMVAVAAAITAVFSYLYFSTINPSMIDYIHQQQEAEMIRQGMSDEAMDRAMAMTAKFTTAPMMSVFALLWTLFFGMLCGLIVSAIVKKPDPNQIS